MIMKFAAVAVLILSLASFAIQVTGYNEPPQIGVVQH